MDVKILDVDVNLVGILLSVVASTAIGFVVYAKAVLGTKWMKLVGLTEAQMNSKDGMGVMFGTMFLMAALVALALSVWVQYLKNIQGYSDITGGLVGGFSAWLFVLSALATNFLFERRPYMLLVIDAGNQLLTFLTIGLIVSFIN